MRHPRLKPEGTDTFMYVYNRIAGAAMDWPFGPAEREMFIRILKRVSEFMRELEQPFTRWFNRTRPRRRKGHLWAERFKNTILENGLAVWDCWKYIDRRSSFAPR